MKSDDILNIATKRGFFFPSGDIYPVKSGFWTYGHLGTLMKHKFENLWRNYFLKLNDNYFEIDDANIMSKDVFKSSGHLENFNDPLIECMKCKTRFKVDDLFEDNIDGKSEKELDELIKKNKIKCPKCNGDLGNVKFFNLMFELKVGATGSEIMYLRPETAQSPFISFKREFMALREKLPMGLAVIGKAFRNEINPRQGFFRLREFTQAELQIFFQEGKFEVNFSEVKDYKIKIMNKEIKCTELKLPKFYVYHLAKVQQFYLDVLKIPKDKFRFRELNEKERAFYNKIHFDVEIDMETLGGFKEVAGVHYRGDHDLKGHKVSINYDGSNIYPHVLELSFGVDRNIWALTNIFYRKDKERELFMFNRNIAPLEVAVFPLVNKDGLPEKSLEIYNLIKDDFSVFYDSKGSIGKMYRRMDEIGCAAMLTIDHDSLKNNDVTLRDRDTMKQIRIHVKDLKETLNKFLNGVELKK